MSKYTTEVRFICEQKSGLTESKGLSNIEEILENSWNKIFTNNWEIFDNNYREILCKKILRKYYTREICAETVGLWVLWLDATMCEIMPEYNKLYESEVIKYNPLFNTDYTREYTKETTGNKNSENNQNTSNEKENTILDNNSSNQSTEYSSINTGSFDEKNKYSDTPQGGLTGLDNDSYLTDARFINRNSQDNTSGNGNLTETNNRTLNEKNIENGNIKGNIKTNENSIEKWTEKIIGKTGSENYNTIIKQFRENILNIDKMIIKELEPLFFNLW